MRESIKIWIVKYCKLHNFRINGIDTPLEYKTKDGRIVDNVNFVHKTKSDTFHSRHHRYWDKVTQAFNWIRDIKDEI